MMTPGLVKMTLILTQNPLTLSVAAFTLQAKIIECSHILVLVGSCSNYQPALELRYESVFFLLCDHMQRSKK